MENLLPGRVGVKLETTLGGESRQLEVKRQPGAGDRFWVAVAAPDGTLQERSMVLLSRNGRRWTFQQGDRIVDVLMGWRGKIVEVLWNHRVSEIEVLSLRDKMLQQAVRAEMEGISSVKAQMPGRVVRVLKGQGDAVETGEGVVIIEAMKMQNEIRSPKSGKVIGIQLQEGVHVQSGDLLFEVE
jgi:biotin carboxyl carrier protein